MVLGGAKSISSQATLARAPNGGIAILLAEGSFLAVAGVLETVGEEGIEATGQEVVAVACPVDRDERGTQKLACRPFVPPFGDLG